MQSPGEMKSRIVNGRLIEAHPDDIVDGVFKCDEVTEVGPGAFNACKESLIEVILPNALRIQNRAFFGCAGMKKCVIPQAEIMPLQRWDAYSAFGNCNALETVVMYCTNDNDSLQSLAECQNLRSIVLFGDPSLDNKKTMYGYCNRRPGIQILFTADLQKNFMMPILPDALPEDVFTLKKEESIDDESIIEKGVLLRAGKANPEGVFRCDTVTEVAPDVFRNRKDIKEVTLPNVIEIGQNAFTGCSLEKFTAPKLKKVGKEAFLLAENLTEIDLSSVTVIEESGLNFCNKLQKCDLSQVTGVLPYSLFSACSALETLTLHPSADLKNNPLPMDHSISLIMLAGGGTAEDKDRIRGQLPESHKNARIESIHDFWSAQTAVSNLGIKDAENYVLNFYTKLEIHKDEAKKRITPKPDLPLRAGASKQADLPLQTGDSKQADLPLQTDDSKQIPDLPPRKGDSKQADLPLQTDDSKQIPDLPPRKGASKQVPDLPLRKARPPADIPQIPVSAIENKQADASVQPARKARPPIAVPVKAEVPQIAVPAKHSVVEQGLFKSDQEKIHANNREKIIKNVLKGVEQYQGGDTNPDDITRCKSLMALLKSEINPHLKIIAITAMLDDDKNGEDKLVKSIKDKLGYKLNYLNAQALSFAEKELGINNPEQLQNAKLAILGQIEDGTYSKLEKIEDKNVFSPDFLITESQRHFGN